MGCIGGKRGGTDEFQLQLELVGVILEHDLLCIRIYTDNRRGRTKRNVVNRKESGETSPAEGRRDGREMTGRGSRS